MGYQSRLAIHCPSTRSPSGNQNRQAQPARNPAAIIQGHLMTRLIFNQTKRKYARSSFTPRACGCRSTGCANTGTAALASTLTLSHRMTSSGKPRVLFWYLGRSSGNRRDVFQTKPKNWPSHSLPARVGDTNQLIGLVT